MPTLQFPPARDWLVFVTFLGVLLGLLAGFDHLVRAQRIRPRLSRKAIHLFTGVLVLASPFAFEEPTLLLAMAAVFAAINLIATRRQALPSIHSTERTSLGTFFYPVAIFLLVWFWWESNRGAMLLGMSLLVIADVVAGLVGQHVKAPAFLPISGERKSLQGSLAMFSSSLVLALIGFRILGSQSGVAAGGSGLLMAATGVALIATAAEAVSWYGSDNLTVPILGGFSAYIFFHSSPVSATQFFAGEVLALLVAVLSYRVRFLDGSGAIATFVLGAFIFGLGGWAFSMPILAFFVLSSALSRLGIARKNTASTKFQKSSRRDFGQVLANGGISGLVVVLWYFLPNPIWYFLYLASIAAVTADTWATEIGLFSHKAPRLITSWQPAAPGTSGAISVLGLVGAVVGATVIALLGWVIPVQRSSYRFGITVTMIIIGSGFFAHLLDSLLGATIQAQHACPICQQVSEKRGRCCGVERQLHSGWNWVDNDVVNGICSLWGLVMALVGSTFAKPNFTI